MSASLVGSEMCIRDRVSPGGATTPDQPDGASRASGLTRGPPPPWTPHSVSYTHLTLPTICSV
eukprot:15165605-Alexandrium_andersonii.AAC.1